MVSKIPRADNHMHSIQALIHREQSAGNHKDFPATQQTIAILPNSASTLNAAANSFQAFHQVPTLLAETQLQATTYSAATHEVAAAIIEQKKLHNQQITSRKSKLPSAATYLVMRYTGCNGAYLVLGCNPGARSPRS